MANLSTNAILQELAYISDCMQEEAIMSGNTFDINEFLEEANSLLETQILTEEQYTKITDRLRIEILDIEKFVSRNNCQCISDPRPFIRDGIPSQEGLVSNEIFGISNEERAGIFAYIDLHGWFIDPSCYKAWTKIDSNVKKVVHGIGTFKIDSHGQIVEDPNGETGIKFLKKNIDKIKFRTNESLKRDLKVNYLNKNRDKMFIKKYLVIPPYYRDKNSGSGRTIGLGGINKLYNSLIIASNAIATTQDFMFDASDAMNARVQETILAIYDWFCGNTNKNINSKDLGQGLSSKLGLIRRANMSKTADFASRLVLSESQLKAERPDEMMVNIDHSAIPLSATIADFRDFITFHVRNFFDNEFMATERYPVLDSKGVMHYVVPKDPFIEFSDERIKAEMERFLHGYNNRFVPIEVPIEGTSDKFFMVFKGRNVTPLEANEEKPKNPIKQRRLTWCDIFYVAAVEATKNKNVLITRFPIDKYSNQITTGITVSSTKETEPIYIGNEYYPHYPKITDKDIGSNTSNSFVDTMQISNAYLLGMCAD